MKMLLEKQCELFSHYVTPSFTMDCHESHKLSMTNAHYILLECIMLHVSSSGNLYILITEFVILGCDGPQETYFIPFLPFQCAKTC